MSSGESAGSQVYWMGWVSKAPVGQGAGIGGSVGSHVDGAHMLAGQWGLRWTGQGGPRWMGRGCWWVSDGSSAATSAPLLGTWVQGGCMSVGVDGDLDPLLI